MSEYEKMIESFDGMKIFMKKQVPDECKAVIVIVHGLAEHQGRYDYVAEKLNAAGIGVYRFDHRGHGKSEGERTFFTKWDEPIDDTNVIVDIAAAENPGLPLFILGHSVGGYTVSLFGAKYPNKNIKGFITSGALTQQLAAKISPDADMHETMPNMLGPGVCSVQSVIDDYNSDPLNCKTITIGLRYCLSKGLEWFSEHNKDFRYPILMLHGEKDSLVAVSNTFKFFEQASSEDKQMKIYAGLFHEILNEYCRDEVISDVIHWIEYRVNK